MEAYRRLPLRAIIIDPRTDVKAIAPRAQNGDVERLDGTAAAGGARPASSRAGESVVNNGLDSRARAMDDTMTVTTQADPHNTHGC